MKSNYSSPGLVYRKITVNENWFNNLKSGDNLGIYWTYDENSAESHWSKEDIEVLLIAEIDSSNIDYKNTYLAHIIPYTGEDEKEIRLLKNTEINIKSIIIKDEEQDLSKFENTIFKA